MSTERIELPRAFIPTGALARSSLPRAVSATSPLPDGTTLYWEANNTPETFDRWTAPKRNDWNYLRQPRRTRGAATMLSI
jgi:hypothetical protein